MEIAEIFTTVAGHLLKQNERSMIEPTSGIDPATCAYRGQRGLKCAAGFLIPDDKYDPVMEGAAVVTVRHEKSIPHQERNVEGSNKIYDALQSIGVDTEKKMQLVRDLQSTHDFFTPDQWPDRLRILAIAYGLDPMLAVKMTSIPATT